MGLLCKQQNEFAEANTYFNKSINICSEIHNIYLLNNLYKELYILNKEQKPEVALYYLEKHVEIKDSLYKAETQTQLNDFQIKYETKEKENKIILQEEEIKHEKYKQSGLILLLIFIATISLLILITTLVVVNKNKQLKELNKTKDKLFSIISHDLQNPVVSQKLAIQALIDNLNEYDNNCLLKYYNSILISTDTQIALLHNLLNWANIQTNKIKFNPITFDINEIINTTINLNQIALNNKSIEVKKDVNIQTLVNADKQMINTVIRNLFTNAIKFTQKGGVIHISAIINQNELIFSITDNGIGMSKEQIEMFYKSGNLSSKDGTNNEKGSGLGLLLCKELLEINNTSLKIKSEKMKGTSFSFTLNYIS